MSSDDVNKEAEAPISAAARADAGSAPAGSEPDRDGDGGYRVDVPAAENDGD